MTVESSRSAEFRRRQFFASEAKLFAVSFANERNPVVKLEIDLMQIAELLGILFQALLNTGVHRAMHVAESPPQGVINQFFHEASRLNMVGTST